MALLYRGPQKYVVQFFHNDAGRIVRERTLQYDASADMMVTLRDEHKTYDLGGNVTEIKFYDVDSYAESVCCLTTFSFSLPNFKQKR
ncbi:MAG TPA: hypothetical protein VGB30_15200 [bacterium]|jgi:hypothetical protein